MNYYRRNKKHATPDNGTGYMMFVEEKKRDHIESYGNFEWVFVADNNTPHINHLREKIISQWAADQDDNFDHCQQMMPEWEASFSGEQIFDDLNPDRIVSTAGAWDNQIIVGWLWDRVLEPNDIMAVITDDGALVFDPDMAKRVDE